MITHIKEYLHVHSLDCNFSNFIFMLCKYFIQNIIQVIVIKFKFKMKEETHALLLNAS